MGERGRLDYFHTMMIKQLDLVRAALAPRSNDLAHAARELIFCCSKRNTSGIKKGKLFPPVKLGTQVIADDRSGTN